MQKTKSNTRKKVSANTGTRKQVVDKVNYLVKTKGYKETFDSLDKARNQLEILKKRAVKNQTRVKIQIYKKFKGNQELIDEVQISDSFYDEE